MNELPLKSWFCQCILKTNSKCQQQKNGKILNFLRCIETRVAISGPKHLTYPLSNLQKQSYQLLEAILTIYILVTKRVT